MVEGTERNGLVEGMGKVDANQVGWLVEVDAKLASENPLVKVDAHQVAVIHTSLISINFDQRILKPV